MNKTGSNDTTSSEIGLWITHIAYPFLSFCGITGNLLVLIVFAKTKKLHINLMNYFVINQSCIDLVAAIVFTISNFCYWYFGDVSSWNYSIQAVYCRIIHGNLLYFALMNSSTYNLVLLSLDRYAGVVHPITHKIYASKRNILLLILGVWLFGPALQFSIQIPISGVAEGKCINWDIFPSELARSAVGVFTFFIQFFLPLVLLTFSYGSIAFSMKTRIEDISTVQSKMEERKGIVRKNTLKTFALVSGCFFLCWVWNQVYFLAYNLGMTIDFQSPYYYFSVIMLFMNCCINPIVYLIKYEQFKQSLWKLLGYEKLVKNSETTNRIHS